LLDQLEQFNNEFKDYKEKVNFQKNYELPMFREQGNRFFNEALPQNYSNYNNFNNYIDNNYQQRNYSPQALPKNEHNQKRF
jgi:hypothetical protein